MNDPTQKQIIEAAFGGEWKQYGNNRFVRQGDETPWSTVHVKLNGQLEIRISTRLTFTGSTAQELSDQLREWLFEEARKIVSTELVEDTVESALSEVSIDEEIRDRYVNEQLHNGEELDLSGTGLEERLSPDALAMLEREEQQRRANEQARAEQLRRERAAGVNLMAQRLRHQQAVEDHIQVRCHAGAYQGAGAPAGTVSRVESGRQGV